MHHFHVAIWSSELPVFENKFLLSWVFAFAFFFLRKLYWFFLCFTSCTVALFQQITILIWSAPLAQLVSQNICLLFAHYFIAFENSIYMLAVHLLPADVLLTSKLKSCDLRLISRLYQMY